MEDDGRARFQISWNLSNPAVVLVLLAINKHGNNMTSHYFKNISVMPNSVFHVFFEGSQNCNCTVFLGLTIREWWIRSGEGVNKSVKGYVGKSGRQTGGNMHKRWCEGVEKEVSRERKKVRKGGVKTQERDAKRAEREGESGRRTERKRPLVSSFLLVIGFSDWSKLFFSILLVSFPRQHLFLPLHGVKDKADGPNCVAGPCSQQWPFEANFPAHGAEKDGERRVRQERGREGRTLRRVQGWRKSGGWRRWEVLARWIRVSF